MTQSQDQEQLPLGTDGTPDPVEDAPVEDFKAQDPDNARYGGGIQGADDRSNAGEPGSTA